LDTILGTVMGSVKAMCQPLLNPGRGDGVDLARPMETVTQHTQAMESSTHEQVSLSMR